MILFNSRIYTKGIIRKGTIFISNGIIDTILYDPPQEDLRNLSRINEDGIEIDCENRLILPGIIDIHSHLRDLKQREKETFLTGTKAAAFSGITTVFDMPNTIPPAIDSFTVKNWMDKARDNIHVNVGFISGVPKKIDEEEIKKILKLGVVGFKIYPNNPLNGVDWKNSDNVKTLFKYSIKYRMPIFIHPEWAITKKEIDKIREKFNEKKDTILNLHDKLHSIKNEARYIKFILGIYKNLIKEKVLTVENYPIIHFCHISCIESFSLIKKALQENLELKLTFEVTPHHLLLSNDIFLKNENFGKALPPLRNKNNPTFLNKELSKGNINIIVTDHAPHTLKEKNYEFEDAPSGFPGFETYPRCLLNRVAKNKLHLDKFVKAASEYPAKLFNIKHKGFLKENYDADLLIIEKVPEYQLLSKEFKTKAKFSPFESQKTSIKIWKVFLRGLEINKEQTSPNGCLLIKHENEIIIEKEKDLILLNKVKRVNKK